MSTMTDEQRAIYFEKAATKYREEAERYQRLLAEAHTLIGRLVHSLSERWDVASITKYMSGLSSEAGRRR